MNYHYFASYHYSVGNGYGMGSCEIVRDGEINSIEVVNSIAVDISKKHNLTTVVIFNYQLMRTEKTQ